MSAFDVVILDCVPNTFKESFGNCFQTKSLDSSMLQIYIANDGTVYGLPDQLKYFIGEIIIYNDKTLEKNVQLKGFVYCGLLLYLMSGKNVLFRHPGLQNLVPRHFELIRRTGGCQMSYKVCDDHALECQVANLIFREGVDYWLGYYTDLEISTVLAIVNTYFHTIAETLITEIRKHLQVTSYFDPVSVQEPEREWELLNLVSTKERQVSYEEFCQEFREHKGWLDSLFQLALVSSLCVVELAIKYYNQLAGRSDVEDTSFEEVNEDDIF